MTLSGGCHCGRLAVEAALTRPLQTYAPRACDCSFCRKHGAAWLSDADGHLRLVFRDDAIRRYRQGSGQADFIACAHCAVLVMVACEVDGRLYGAVNARALGDDALLAEVQVASPQTLGPDDKRARWQQLWFSDVCIEAMA